MHAELAPAVAADAGSDGAGLCMPCRDDASTPGDLQGRHSCQSGSAADRASSKSAARYLCHHEPSSFLLAPTPCAGASKLRRRGNRGPSARAVRSASALPAPHLALGSTPFDRQPTAPMSSAWAAMASRRERQPCHQSRCAATRVFARWFPAARRCCGWDQTYRLADASQTRRYRCRRAAAASLAAAAPLARRAQGTARSSCAVRWGGGGALCWSAADVAAWASWASERRASCCDWPATCAGAAGLPRLGS